MSDYTTPRPWAIDPVEPCLFGGDLQGSEGEWGVEVGEARDPEDAALIVLAVNERDALVAENQRLRGEIETTEEWADEQGFSGLAERLREALAGEGA